MLYPLCLTFTLLLISNTTVNCMELQQTKEKNENYEELYKLATELLPYCHADNCDSTDSILAFLDHMDTKKKDHSINEEAMTTYAEHKGNNAVALLFQRIHIYKQENATPPTLNEYIQYHRTHYFVKTAVTNGDKCGFTLNAHALLRELSKGDNAPIASWPTLSRVENFNTLLGHIHAISTLNPEDITNLHKCVKYALDDKNITNH